MVMPHAMGLLALTLGLSDGDTPVASDDDYTLNVAIVLYDGVELLDFAGPGEVFQVAGGYAASKGRRGYEVMTVAANAEPVLSQNFLTVVPQYSIRDAPRPDVLVIPGGSTAALLNDHAFMAWVRDLSSESVILTVCTGAFVAAELGLLDGHTVTTWHGAVERLAERAPEAQVIHGPRFLDNGNVITTAGVSAGIDGALHLVARTFGKVVADETARYMEYQWSPEPYLACRYSLLNPRLDERGRAVQQANLLFTAKDWPAAIDAYRAALDGAGTGERDEAEQAEGEVPVLLRNLGYALMSSGRYEEAIEVYGKLAEHAGMKGLACYNLACSHARLGHQDEALDALERAIEAGFDRPEMMMHDADLESIRHRDRFVRLQERLSRPQPE